MKSKKKVIQEMAIKLFNEKGYEQVSLRNVAMEANTTIGNLTYHFPHKEDLLLTIQKEFHATFEVFFSSPMNELALLGQIIDSFLQAEKNEKESSFYYKNIYDLTKDSAVALKENMAFQKKLYDYYHSSFMRLREDGIIGNGVEKNSIEALTYTIITVQAVWLQTNAPYSNPQLDKMPIAVLLSVLLKPYIAVDKLELFNLVCQSRNMSI